jgi:membrane protease YdiL (CAAX protease family)
MPDYLRATRHPWPTTLFLLPLIITYEIGVMSLGGADGMSLRNGADVWIRRWLGWYGVKEVWLPPTLLILVLLIWTWWRWADRPANLLTALFGIILESVVFAAILYLISHNFRHIVQQSGLPIQSLPVAPLLNQPDRATVQLITFIGAGIYEEALFRLGLYRLLLVFLRITMPGWMSLVLASILGSIGFAAAHHMGQQGEPIVPLVFLFRTLAGLFFTALCMTRGFGIAVGTHAGYDVLVGVSVG